MLFPLFLRHSLKLRVPCGMRLIDPSELPKIDSLRSGPIDLDMRSRTGYLPAAPLTRSFLALVHPEYLLSAECMTSPLNTKPLTSPSRTYRGSVLALGVPPLSRSHGPIHLHYRCIRLRAAIESMSWYAGLVIQRRVPLEGHYSAPKV